MNQNDEMRESRLIEAIKGKMEEKVTKERDKRPEKKMSLTTLLKKVSRRTS